MTRTRGNDKENGLTTAPGTSGNGDDPLRILREAATRDDPDTTIATVRSLRDSARESGSVIATVNTFAFAEFAAELRPPADVARLVTELGSEAASADLARLALDAAAARRTVADLDLLTGCLADQGHAREAGHLLEAVVRRRMPRDIAALLVVLLPTGREMMIGQLNDDRTPGDCRISVILWLRAHGHGELSEETARLMAARLGRAPLADLVRGLFSQQDTASADAAIGSALNRDLGEVAALIGTLRDAPGYRADHAVTMALDRLEPDDLMVLASLLDDGIWDEGAQRIWDKVVPDMREHELVNVLSRFAEHAERPLRRAAQTHSIERVSILAMEVQGRIPDGEKVVLEAVASLRSVEEIFEMSGRLTDLSLGAMARALLDDAAARVHTRADGHDVADFIDRLLEHADGRGTSRGARRRRHRLARPILDATAERHDPEQLMGLIDGLARPGYRGHRWYPELHEDVEQAVATCYTGAELARLPLIRRLAHLPAVLEIEKKSLEMPRDNVLPRYFPQVAQALEEAGATTESRRSLFKHVGAKHMNWQQLCQVLVAANLREEAEWVFDGHKTPPLREPRFYEPGI